MKICSLAKTETQRVCVAVQWQQVVHKPCSAVSCGHGCGSSQRDGGCIVQGFRPGWSLLKPGAACEAAAAAPPFRTPALEPLPTLSSRLIHSPPCGSQASCATLTTSALCHSLALSAPPTPNGTQTRHHTVRTFTHMHQVVRNPATRYLHPHTITQCHQMCQKRGTHRPL